VGSNQTTWNKTDLHLFFLQNLQKTPSYFFCQAFYMDVFTNKENHCSVGPADVTKALLS